MEPPAEITIITIAHGTTPTGRRDCAARLPLLSCDIRTSVRPDVSDPHHGGPLARIVLVGAGSVEFTRNLLGDILSSPALRSSDIALHDIDPDRLRTAERMARWTADALGANPTVTAHLDRREALEGAQFVVNTIQVGGARATRVDFEVPARFGLRYTIADTIGVGGVFRGLRTIPVVLAIARDMEAVCPDAWLLNYTNPLAILVRAVSEASLDPSRRTVPLRLLDDRSAGRLSGRRPRGPGGRQCRPEPPRVHHATRARRPRRLSAPARVRRVGERSRRRPGPCGPVSAPRLLPDRIVGASRGVQPVVHRKDGRPGRRRRAVQRANRRVPGSGRPQSR